MIIYFAIGMLLALLVILYNTFIGGKNAEHPIGTLIIVPNFWPVFLITLALKGYK